MGKRKRKQMDEFDADFLKRLCAKDDLFLKIMIRSTINLLCIHPKKFFVTSISLNHSMILPRFNNWKTYFFVIWMIRNSKAQTHCNERSGAH